MSEQDTIYMLAERIAKAELHIGIKENRVRNPSAFERKVRDNMLERTQQRGTGWLVEQGNRFGVDIPEALKKHQPTPDEVTAKKPAVCRTCGIALFYDPLRRVEILDGWPFAVSPCARGKSDTTTCYTYQEREEANLIRPWRFSPAVV